MVDGGNPKSKIQNLKSKIALASSGVLLKKVKHSMVCHPERSEGSLQSFSLANCGDASPAKRDQHDSVRVARFTYLRNAALAPFSQLTTDN